MRTKIQKWGNSYAVRLPKQMIVRLGLQTGSPVVIHQENEGVVVTKTTPSRTVTTKDWKNYLISMGKRKKLNLSCRVDEIVYGSSSR